MRNSLHAVIGAAQVMSLVFVDALPTMFVFFVVFYEVPPLEESKNSKDELKQRVSSFVLRPSRVLIFTPLFPRHDRNPLSIFDVRLRWQFIEVIAGRPTIERGCTAFEGHQ